MSFGTKFLHVPCSLIEKWGLGRFTESVLACCHTNQFAQGSILHEYITTPTVTNVHQIAPVSL